MSLFSRITSLFRSQQVDQDIEDELRAHLEMRAKDNLSAGMSKEDAELDARRRFGNSGLIQERTRGEDILLRLETFLQDVRYGLRALHRSPAGGVEAIFR